MSDVPPRVRPAVADDLPRLVTLLRQLYDDGTPGEVPVSAAEHEAFGRLLADPDCRVYVVGGTDGALIGTCTLYLLPNLTHGGRPRAIVENVVVDAAWRGHGVGARLMDHVEEVARAAGCYTLSLASSYRRLDAHRFYDRLGFERRQIAFSKSLSGPEG